MFKLILSNIREIIVIAILFVLMLFGMDLLADKSVAANGPMSELVALGVSVLTGVFKFAACLALAWFGLSITFPEAGRFVHGSDFDDWWHRLDPHRRAFVCLIAAGILCLVAGMCMSK